MSFPRYPEYKDSGVECLGLVPNHWEIKRLKHLADIQNGRDYKEVESDEGYPVVGSGGPFSFASCFIYQGESVLLGRKGTIDRPLYVNGAFWAVDTMFYTVIKPRVNARFLYFCTLTIKFDRYSTNTALPSMTQSDLNNIEFAVPCYEEQCSITAFLERETTKIDGLMAEQEKLITLLKEKRQAVIANAVTKGLDPTVPMKDSGVEWLGEVPAHWQVQRMANLFTEVVESGDDSLPVLSVSIHSGVSDKELNDSELDRKVTRSDDRGKYKKVQPGDLVYNMMRAWQGGFGSVTVKGQVSPAYVVARPIADFCTAFIEQVLRTPQAVEEMRRHSQGVTDFRLRLYWQEFKCIQAALPDKGEQEAILAFIAAVNGQLEVLEAEAQHAIDLLKERRTALISAAVTGQIDVRGLIKEEQEQAA